MQFSQFYYMFENISKIDVPNRQKIRLVIHIKLSRNHLFTNHESAKEFPSLQKDCTTADSTYYRHQTKRDYGPLHPILWCFNERNQWSLNYFSGQITITLHISYTLIIAKHTNLKINRLIFWRFKSPLCMKHFTSTCPLKQLEL